MAQYNTKKDDFISNNQKLFEVDMLATEDGQLVNDTNPLPVTLGSDNITITGSVNVGSTVEITNDVGAPVPINGTVIVENDHENPLHAHIHELGNIDISGSSLPISGTITAEFNEESTLNTNILDENGVQWYNRYNKDAYGRPKTITDHSIFREECTYRVSQRVWEMVKSDFSGGLPPSSVISAIDDDYITSENGMLVVKSGTEEDIGYNCRSKRFIRSQPNRGQLFSVSATFPNPTAIATRTIGLTSAENGLSFRLTGDNTDWQLDLIRRNGGVNVNTINLNSYLPDGFDPSKGHLYDIQFQWRGVGNIFVFIDTKLIYTLEILGTLDYLSMQDNAMPVVVSAICNVEGTAVETRVGCVDISTEGGMKEDTLFGNINTGTGFVSVDDVGDNGSAVLAIRAPRHIDYNGDEIFNTRGAILDKIVSWCRDEAVTSVWVGRDYDCSNLEGLTWDSINDSYLQSLVGGRTSALDGAFVSDKSSMMNILSEWTDLEQKNTITNPSTSSRFVLSPGDIVVIHVSSFGGNDDCFANLYYSEQI